MYGNLYYIEYNYLYMVLLVLEKLWLNIFKSLIMLYCINYYYIKNLINWVVLLCLWSLVEFLDMCFVLIILGNV